MSALLKDLRYAARGLRRSPALTVTAVFALGMGVGLTAIMFSIVYGALLIGLPFDDSHELIHLERSNLPAGIQSLGVSIHDYEDWRQAQRSFEDLAAFSLGTVNVSGTERAERFDGAFMTANTFDPLGVQPVRGRLFREGDDEPGAEPVVLIGYEVWRDRYGLDEDVIGRSVRVNGEATTIVGVMPEGFRFPIEQQIWVPLKINPLELERGSGSLYEVFGRLRDGVSMDQALLDVSGIARRLAAEYPESNEGVGVIAQPYTDEFVGGEARGLLFTMLGAVFLVLVIACANVANLLLVRAATRSKEVAVRTALGASRRRVVGQLLMESLVLALLGTGLGVLVAWVGTGAFARAIVVAEPPFWMQFGLLPPVLGFVALLGLFAALVSGMIPALQASGADVNAILKDESRGSSGFRIGRMSRGLVVVEIALSVALLASAGLMIKSITNLRSVDYGFEPEGVFTARVGLFETDFPEPADRRAFFEELLRQLERVPDAQNAALATGLPGVGACCWRFSIDGQTYERDQDRPLTARAAVTPGFFEALGIERLSGRALGTEDVHDGLQVAVVNAAFQAEFFPGGALGQRVQIGGETEFRSIVGVVADSYMHGLGNDDEPNGPGLFLPLAQTDARFVSIAVRARGNPMALAGPVRDAVTAVDRNTPIYFVRSMVDAIAQQTWFYRIFGVLFMIFGAVALFLASIGLYGVMSFSVSRRTQEVGIRMAMGAEARDVIRLILKQGLVQLALGVTLGLGLAVLLSRALQLLLFEVTPGDPTIYGGIVLILGATALVASFVPARRATRVDPMVAFRAE